MDALLKHVLSYTATLAIGALLIFDPTWNHAGVFNVGAALKQERAKMTDQDREETKNRDDEDEDEYEAHLTKMGIQILELVEQYEKQHDIPFYWRPELFLRLRDTMIIVLAEQDMQDEAAEAIKQ